MEEKTVEGIVMRSQDYKERHRIITLFTPEGLMGLIVRGISRKNARLLLLTTPFCHGQYHLIRGQTELLSFRDGTVLNDHLPLRQSLKAIQTAGSFASAILASQMPGKSAPALFALYKSYLGQVPHFSDPEVLLASFYLKLLKHEGSLDMSPCCSICNHLSALYLYQGESLCSEHAEGGAIGFTSLEWQLLLTLCNTLQFSSLRDLILAPEFYKKIQGLFRSYTGL